MLTILFFIFFSSYNQAIFVENTSFFGPIYLSE